MLFCPVCNSAFRVSKEQLSVHGRMVACSKCDHEWLARPADLIVPSVRNDLNASSSFNNSLLNNSVETTKPQPYDMKFSYIKTSAINPDARNSSIHNNKTQKSNINLSVNDSGRMNPNTGDLNKNDLSRYKNVKLNKEAFAPEEKETSIHFILIFIILNILTFSGIIGLEYWDTLRNKFNILNKFHDKFFKESSYYHLRVTHYQIAVKGNKNSITFRIENNSPIYQTLNKLSVIGFDVDQKQISTNIVPIQTSIYPGMYKNISITLSNNLSTAVFFSLYINDILLIDKEQYYVTKSD